MEPELERLSTVELFREITGKGTELVRKEVELAVAEAKSDLRAELVMLKLFAAAAVGAISALNLLLLAAVLALADVMPGWQAALAFAAAVAALSAVLGFVGWRKRVTRPLALTRESVKED